MRLFTALLLFLALPAFSQTQAPAPAPAPAPGPTLKAQLSKKPLAEIIIPEVAFDQVPLSDAVAAFTTLVDTATKGAIKLQWIDRALDRKKWPTTVTLTAKNLSAGKVLNEILTQAGLEAKLEDHAIVLSPKTRVVERRVVPTEKKAETPKVDSGPAYDTLRKNPVAKP